MTSTEQFDVIIIGTGQSGMPLAHELDEAGHKTAIIERHLVGGTCVNVGCTPTKTMVASARIAHLARRAEDYGVHVGKVQVNQSEIRQRKQAVVESFRSGDQNRLQTAENVDLIMGEASFTGPRQVGIQLNEGGERILTAPTVIVNTGARPRLPDIPGLQDVGALDYTTVMDLDVTPENLLVLGGGYVGVEFGQMFRRFGSRVSIIQRGPQILSREDPDVAGALTKILRDEGVEVLLETEAIQAEMSAEGGVQLTVTSEDGEMDLSGSHLLVAAGRVPNTDVLHLEKAEIEVDDRGYIRTDEQLRTTADGVYAMGDVKGGPAFTHISYDDYRIIAANLIHDEQRSVADRMVPYTVFTDPQLGRVGLTEQQAEERGYAYRVAQMPMSYVARAIEVDETRGMMKALVDEKTDQLLGCAILGLEGGEMMGALQIAMMGGLPYTALRDGVFAHPTLTEAFNNLFQAFED